MTPPLSIFYYQNHPIYYRPNTVDEEVLAHSFANDIFYTGAPEYKGTKDAIVIDVGGHIGTFSIYSILSSKTNKVIVLEPNKESFEILEKNILENNLSDRIIAIQCALSDKNGLVRLYLDEENWGHSLTNLNLKNYEEVTSISVSSLFEQQKIEKCDLIKFNCEGAEFQVILSLDRTILSKIKLMIILFHEDLINGLDRKSLTNFLGKNGFLTRTDFEENDRGWIIAKNTAFYGRAEHEFIQLKRYLHTSTNRFRLNVLRVAADTKLWTYAKRIIRKF